MAVLPTLTALAMLAAPGTHRGTSPAALPPLNAVAGYPDRATPISDRLGDPRLVKAGMPLELEGRYGVPSFVWAAPSADAISPRQAGATPGAAALEHLQRFAPLYGLSASQAGQAVVLGVHDLGQGAVVVRLGQSPGGVRVFGQELAVIMDHQLRAVALSGYLTPLPRPARASLGAVEATASALSAAGHDVDLARLHAVASRRPGELALMLAASADGLSLVHPARVRRVLFALPDKLLPAYHIEFLATSAGHPVHEGYSVVISAVDGAPLFRRSQVQADAFSYRVWASDDAADGGTGAPYDGPQGDSPTPNPTGDINQPLHPPFVAANLLTLDHGPTLLPDPWLAPDATETVGNNADAYVDLFAPDGYSPNTGDFRAALNGPNSFDRTYDLTLGPQVSADQQQAAITQLFYDVNYFHDWYYGVGFTEAAGNAQQSNYGRGGIEGDPLHAEAQDYSGTDNSNMYTPSDGESPVMQMYIWNGASVATLLVTAPASVAKTYSAAGADFGPSTYSLSGTLALLTAANHDGCTAFSSADNALVNGKIALIDRGTCDFVTKIAAAQAAGAIGVVIIQNTADAPFELDGDSTGVTIPSQMISQADGQTLRAASGVAVTLGQAKDIDRDGDLDNQIVGHEWGHYISNRLMHDGQGLNTNMSGGMGEGWADNHAMLLTVKAEDALVDANADWNGTYALTGYVAAASDPDHAYYWGIRRVPYSTDMSKDPLTYADIQEGYPLSSTVPISFGQDGVGNSEVHNTGEVWCTMLWESYAALLRDTPTRFSFEEAQTRMRTYLVEAYQATPVNPTFLESRDAILAVAYASDLADFADFQKAFAKRGAGLHAVSPDRFSSDNVGVVEDYSYGNDLGLVSASVSDDITSCDHDGVLDDGESGYLNITVKNVGGAPLRDTTATVVSADPTIQITSPSIAIPETDPFGPSVTAKIPVSVSGAVGIVDLALSVAVSDPELTGGQSMLVPFEIAGNYDVLPATSTTDTVESPALAWTATALNGNDDIPGEGSTPYDTSVSWTRIAESATDHRLFGVDDDQPSELFLGSPPLQVGARDWVIHFRARWAFEIDTEVPDTNYDGAVLEISTDDGDTWTDIGAGATVAADGSNLYGGKLYDQSGNPLSGRAAIVNVNPSWPALDDVSLDLGTTYAGQTVRVRFAVGSDAASAIYGIDLDDLAFGDIGNTPFDQVVADRHICEANPPIAKPSGPSTVRGYLTGQLDGSASVSTHGEPLTFQWTQLSGPSVVLDDPTSQHPGFVAPQVVVPTRAIFQLVVNDGVSNSLPATVGFTLIHGADPAPPSPKFGTVAAPSGCTSGGAGLELLALLAAMGALRRRSIAERNP